jgi:hypothetical protein
MNRTLWCKHLLLLLLIAFSTFECYSEELCQEDLEVAGTALIQKNLQLQLADASPSQVVARTKSNGRLLIMIVSHHNNAHLWKHLLEWGDQVHPGGDVLILAGIPPNRTLQQPYELSLSKRTLIVNASDAYDSLAVKVFLGYNSIYADPQLAGITHVFKIDDTTVRDGTGVFKLTGFNATQAQSAVASQPLDYLTSEFGYNVYDCAARPPEDMEWHFGRVPNTSYWNNRHQPCDWVFAYGNGEYGYFLSRRALGLISSHWPVSSMDEFYHQFIYEDMAVGVTMMKEGVRLYPAHLTGMKPWNENVCPCSPPSQNGMCDSYCQEHMAEEHTRCCFQACRQYTGLCEDIKFIS